MFGFPMFHLGQCHEALIKELNFTEVVCICQSNMFYSAGLFYSYASPRNAVFLYRNIFLFSLSVALIFK